VVDPLLLREAVEAEAKPTDDPDLLSKDEVLFLSLSLLLSAAANSTSSKSETEEYPRLRTAE